MPQQEFEICIAPDGLVELHVKGCKGKRCLDVAKMFEEIIGEMKARRETSEYYEPDDRVSYDLGQRNHQAR